MPSLDPIHVAGFTILVSLFAGAIAGTLGAMLGIGGGVLLVPLLNVGLGLPFEDAAGISLMAVMATSNMVAASGRARRVINLRLGMLMQIAAVAGALSGALVVERLPIVGLYLLFATVTAGIAAVTMTRLDRRNVILDSSVDPGVLGGRFHDQESGCDVVYRVRRLPAALCVAAGSGVVSGLLGIGGGILQVPALNSWCGVPIRAAAATSAAMLGITALGSAPIYLERGHVAAPLAAAAVLGVIAGTRLGLRLSERSNVRSLKTLMAGVLTVVSVAYFYRSFAQ
jgi:uncharacterized membrane protein YfcA